MAEPHKTIDYKTLSTRLDEVVAAMQAPEVTVDEAIKYYEEGMKLVAEIEAYLKDAEHKIHKVRI